MKRFSFSYVALVLAPAAIVVSACSSSSSNDAGSACDTYFQALESDRCGTNIHTDARKAELQKAFHDLCLQALAEPGIGFGASELNACSAAYNGRACGDPTPEACKFKSGTLANGGGCIDSAQCQSGYCKDKGQTGASGGDGGAAPSYCGTCAATIPDGGDCSAGDTPCVDNDACVKGKCTAVVKGQAGDTCDFATKQCDTSLSCDLQTMKCVTLKAVGDTCTSGSDCQHGLACISGKCANKLAEGGDCTSGDQCAPPLGCDPSTKKCAKHPIAAPGADCDTFTVCDSGSCQFQSGSGTPKGTCSAVIAPGGACQVDGASSTAQCDDFTSCIDGTCKNADASLCK